MLLCVKLIDVRVTALHGEQNHEELKETKFEKKSKLRRTHILTI